MGQDTEVGGERLLEEHMVDGEPRLFVRFNSLISIIIKAVQELNIEVGDLKESVEGIEEFLKKRIEEVRVGFEGRLRWLEQSDRSRRAGEATGLSAAAATPDDVDEEKRMNAHKFNVIMVEIAYEVKRHLFVRRWEDVIGHPKGWSWSSADYIQNRDRLMAFYLPHAKIGPKDLEKIKTGDVTKWDMGPLAAVLTGEYRGMGRTDPLRQLLESSDPLTSLVKDLRRLKNKLKSHEVDTRMEDSTLSSFTNLVKQLINQSFEARALDQPNRDRYLQRVEEIEDRKYLTPDEMAREAARVHSVVLEVVRGRDRDIADHYNDIFDLQKRVETLAGRTEMIDRMDTGVKAMGADITRLTKGLAQGQRETESRFVSLEVEVDETRRNVGGLNKQYEELWKAHHQEIKATIEDLLLRGYDEDVNAVLEREGRLKVFEDDADLVWLGINSSDGCVIYYASARLRADQRIVLHAVKDNGTALEFAADELRDDPKIVTEAVKQNGRALEFASARLRADQRIVLCAVKDDGTALEFAAVELRDDQDIVQNLRYKPAGVGGSGCPMASARRILDEFRRSEGVSASGAGPGGSGGSSLSGVGV
mmetsp:Transcript_87904/g.250651  ORF Transcript_87904/g.250651 Transcript_87904/m.250651 type:complete len:591 (+) Transcript_87904:985-2757(+)